MSIAVGRSPKFLVAAALAIAVLPAAAGAGIITEDHFVNYANLSALVGQGGWQAHSGGGSKVVTVNNSRITLQQSAGSGEDINKRWFTPLATNVKTYASLNLIVTGTIGTGTDYFTHFRPAPTDTNGFVARVYVGPGSDATHYTLHISSGSSASTTVVPYPGQFEVGTEYKVVYAYEAVSGDATLWVNPSTEASPSVIGPGVATTQAKPLESVAFRQAAPTGATLVQSIGDIAVGSSFYDVFHFYSKSVPAASDLGLGLIALSMLVGGAFFVLARRRAVTA